MAEVEKMVRSIEHDGLLWGACEFTNMYSPKIRISIMYINIYVGSLASHVVYISML